MGNVRMIDDALEMLPDGDPRLKEGREMLENWAEWSLDDSARVGYPGKSPTARFEVSSEVWNGDEDSPRCPYNAEQAAQTERHVQTLPHLMLAVVRAFYLETDTTERSARRLNMSLRRYHWLLDRAAVIVAETEADRRASSCNQRRLRVG